MISHGNRTEWRTIQGVIGLVIVSNLLSNYEPDISERSVKETTRAHSRQVGAFQWLVFVPDPLKLTRNSPHCH